jgi:hypothetical protein
MTKLTKLVTATKGTRDPATASQTVSVVAGSPANIEIDIQRCIPDCQVMTDQYVNPGDKLIVSGTIIGGDADGQPVTYTWSIPGGVFETSNVFFGNLSSSSFVVNSGNLLKGNSYTIQVNSVHAGASGTNTRQIQVNSGPCCGTATATNDDISSNWWENTWTISVDQWTSTLVGRPPSLSYMFTSPDGKGNYIPLQAQSDATSYSGLFSPGSQTVRVFVYDIMGASTTVDVSFSVPNAVITNVSAALGSVLDGGGQVNVGALQQLTAGIFSSGGSDDAATDQILSLLGSSSSGATDPSTALAFASILTTVGNSGSNVSSAAAANAAAALQNVLASFANTPPDPDQANVIFGATASVYGLIGQSGVNSSLSKRDIDSVFYTNDYNAMDSTLDDSFNIMVKGIVGYLFQDEPGLNYSSPNTMALKIQRLSVANMIKTITVDNLNLNLPKTLLNGVNGQGDLTGTGFGYSLVKYFANRFHSNITIKGHISSLSFYSDIGPFEVDNLADDIKIDVAIVSSLDSGKVWQCLWFDYVTGDWSTEGCNATVTSGSKVTCSCNHATDFSIAEADESSTSHSPTSAGVTQGSSTTGGGGIPIGPVAGAVAGGVVVVGIIIAAAVIARKRIAARRAPQAQQGQQGQQGQQQPSLIPPQPSAVPTKEVPQQPRAWSDSKDQASKRDKHVEDNAATKIQSVWRGHEQRKKYKGMRRDKDSKKLASMKVEEDRARENKRLEAEERARAEERKKKNEAKKEAEKTPVKAPAKAPTAPAKTVSPPVEKKEKPNAKEAAFSPEQQEKRQRAAQKIQRTYRKYLQRSDYKREKEIEQLLFDIDELLALEM